MEIFLEILKVTIPALIVFLTVYFLFKKYIEGQLKLKAMELKEQQAQTGVPLKFQAYERLSLFCERISMPNLLMRLPAGDMNNAQYQVALLLAIQQEYEHNITQQVYVSAQLWSIIKAAKDDAVNFVSIVADKVDAKGPAEEIKNALITLNNQRAANGPDTALLAIKKEASVFL